MTLAEAIQAYLREPFAPNTHRRLKRCLGAFLTFVGDVDLETIKLAQLLAFKQTFDTKTSQREYLRVVRAFFTFVNRNFEVETIRAERIALPKVYSGSWGCFSHEEIAKLRQAIQAEPCPHRRARDAAMFEVMYSTGLRRAELMRLAPADLDREKRLFSVRVKNDKPRLAYLTPRALAALDAHVAANKPTSSYFPATDRALYCRFRAWGARAGIQHCHPHMLRKSFATHLWQQGADIYQVSRLARHESVDTTQKYIIVTEEEDRQAHARYTGENRRFTFEEKKGDTVLVRADVFVSDGVNLAQAKKMIRDIVEKIASDALDT